jgi:hypothetical protein
MRTKSFVLVLGGCYTTQAPDVTDGVYSTRYSKPFGHVSAGIVPYTSFFGGIEGVDSGMGFSCYMPPLLPVQTVGLVGYVLAPVVAVGAIIAGEGDTAAAVLDSWDDFGVLASIDPRAGQHDALRDVTKNVLSDVSMDLGLSVTLHEDLLYGGELVCTSVLLGARFAGPRERRPRVYVCGGFGLYWFDFENRPDATVPGPYAAIGVEHLSARSNTALGLEVRGTLFTGRDDDGATIDGGSVQAIADVGFYW